LPFAVNQSEETLWNLSFVQGCCHKAVIWVLILLLCWGSSEKLGYCQSSLCMCSNNRISTSSKYAVTMILAKLIF